MDRAPHQLVDVHDGITSTLAVLADRIAPGVTVTTDFDRSVPRIPAFPGELNLVWTNLIDNALYAMGGAGTLEISTRADDLFVLVEVTDTGPGVPPDVAGRVFEPFFTTKPMGQGSGLGLDTAWRIVTTRHHGDLRFDSEPGRTTFHVRLPVHEVD